MSGFSPRGMDITSDGVVWAALASGHLASFDRRLCKGPLNGPIAADAQKACPEGWKLYQLPGPSSKACRKARRARSAEAPYYDVGRSVRHAGPRQERADRDRQASPMRCSRSWTANGSCMRVPYPMGYFAKGMDGRIDDPNAGWKGKGLFSTYSERSPTHIEGGKGQTSKVVHFQIRPDPLAK